jgi:hypothetical protein
VSRVEHPFPEASPSRLHKSTVTVLAKVCIYEYFKFIKREHLTFIDLPNSWSPKLPFFLLANDGCLQYFTGVSGQMRSFNYNDAAGLQLSNTDYTMCVRTERNFCGIQYTACPDTGYPFIYYFNLYSSR